MDIKPEILERLLDESDERLWETVKRVAAMNNIALPERMPAAKDMEALRLLLRQGNLRYEDALTIIERQRKGNPS